MNLIMFHLIWVKRYDIKFQLELREYKILGNTEIMDAVARLNAALSIFSSRASTKETAKIYTVKAGETLYDIAKRQLGSGEKYVNTYYWRRLYLNNILEEFPTSCRIYIKIYLNDGWRKYG